MMLANAFETWRGMMYIIHDFGEMQVSMTILQ